MEEARTLSALRQVATDSSEACHDRTTKATGNRRQIEAASDALSLDPSRLASTAYMRKIRMLGSSLGGAHHKSTASTSPMVQWCNNGALGVEEPGAVTDSEQATQTPMRVEATSTTIEVPVASRRWWNFDLMCRSKKVIPKEWVLELKNKAQRTKDMTTSPEPVILSRHLGPH